MVRDCLGNVSLLGSRVRAGVLGAAGLLDGLEFHEFDARAVGVVNVELPFAAAANFRFFGGIPAIFNELLLGRVNVCDAEGNVVHDAKCVMIGVWRNIDHEFDPVVTIGDLKRHPVGLIVLHAAMPVRTEAEDVFVEVLFSGAVVDDEAGVNNL